MEKVSSRRRDGKHPDSLEDSASASGRILSYQRLNCEGSPQATGKSSKCLESRPLPVYSSRARQRARAAEGSQQKHSTPRLVDSNAGSAVIKPRLSSTSLHQIHHEYNQHPSFLDHHERTRQWLDSAEHPAVVVIDTQITTTPESTTARFQAIQRSQQRRHVKMAQPSTGCFSFFSCFKPQTIELQQSAVVTRKPDRSQQMTVT